MSAAPKPLAEGRLEATPLAHVVLSLHAKEMSGTLAIWPADGRPGQDRILIERGRIVAARPLEAAATLERSLLPLFARPEGPYAFYEGDLVGGGEGVLRDSVDPPALVAASLRGGAPEAAMRRVLSGLGEQRVRLRRGSMLERLALNRKEEAFIELTRTGPDTIAGFVANSGDPIRAERLLYLLAITQLLEAAPVQEAPTIRTPPPLPPLPAMPSPPPARADNTGQWRTSNVVSTPAPVGSGASPSQSGRMPATSAAKAQNAPAQQPTPTSSVRAPKRIRGSEPAPPPAPIRSTVAPARGDATGAHRALSSKAPASASLRAAALEPRPRAGLSAADRERWEELLLRAAAIEDETYFDMLGVDAQADSKTVDSAYFAAVKTWHPDRLPRALDPVKDKAQRVFKYLTEARETLNDARKRLRYRETVADGGGTPAHDRKMNLLVAAAVEYQKVEVLVRRHAWRDALTHLEELVVIAPEESDYHAMLAWVLFQRHGTTKGEVALQIRSEVDTALKQRPDHDRALYLKGLLLKSAGKENEALTYFRQAIEANPNHTDAEREVRLAEMRRGKGSQGVLGKFFGRK